MPQDTRDHLTITITLACTLMLAAWSAGYLTGWILAPILMHLL